MILSEEIFRELKKLHKAMSDKGELLSLKQLEQYYTTFRQKFGPEALQNLDGEALLDTMHNQSNRDSLVYWLEFKNDDEFPAIFGSIGGGSALKFGIYRRKETGIWMAGSPQNQKELSLQEAIEIARKHREQLVRGAELLEQLPPNAGDEAYRHLQEQMDEVAPDVSTKSWGHKYFTLLYPEKLDDFHAENHQRFHLITIQQIPPKGHGRYLLAGRYVAMAAELDVPMKHLIGALSGRAGPLHRYWRVGTKLGGTDSRWDLMRKGNWVGVGWSEISDLSDITHNSESKERIRAALQEQYPNPPQTIGRETQQLLNFVAVIAEDDLVMASDGMRVLGIGRVTGGYTYAPDSDIPHRRPVEWLALDEWQLPIREGLRTTVHEMGKNPENLIEVERRIIDGRSRRPECLPGIPGRIQAILERKKQVILYGPPGTGKTYWAKTAALKLAAQTGLGIPFDQLTDDQKTDLSGEHDEALVRTCTFHPAYGYEDFIEGYRPHAPGGQLSFECRDGIFKRLCDAALRNPDQAFYLIIDEINRGDIPRIFGELLTILEKDKRGDAILLPLSGKPFSVPDNVYVIGTMNTADRSIALLDTALRRRFGFIELMPDSSVLENTVVGESIPLGPWLDELNSRILEYVGRDARNLQIGHAYLMENGRPVQDFARFARIVQDDILPLLEEYCYEDYSTLAKILGGALVDENRQRIRHELFASDKRDNLVQALLAPFPEITASSTAITSEAEQPDENNDEEDEDQTEADGAESE